MERESAMSALTYIHANGIATITFHNPPQNRLSNAVQLEFRDAITDITARDDTRVIYVKSEGPDFSFGADITPWPTLTREQTRDLMGTGLRLSNAFADLPVPIVMAVQGHCMGGGFELALRSDIIIAADNAKFGHSEATIGVFTFLGGVQRVAERVGRTRAIQWALTAELVDAPHAHEIGLINEVVPLDELESAAQAWVKKLASGATLSHAAHKKLLRAWSTGGIQGADELMPDMAAEIMRSEDVQGSLVGAIEAARAGRPRPAYPFRGR